MTRRMLRHPAKDQFEIGWRETIALPDLSIPAIRAKIDTGARTSALHAVDLVVQEREGVKWIDFHVPLPDTPRACRCSTRILDERNIKNTSGVKEMRYIVATTLVLGSRHWRIEVSLADRENMEFDLILGRTAIRGRHLLVNPGKSNLAGPPVDLTTDDSSPLNEGLLGTIRSQ